MLIVPDVIQTGKIQKIDNDLQIIYGWASVITKNGVPVVDTQDDQIHPNDLLKTAHEFIEKYGSGGFMHVPNLEGGRVVESVVFTYDLQKSLGIKIVDKAGDHVEGWLIGYQVKSDALWKRVKAGDFTEFSIGGSADRVPA